MGVPRGTLGLRGSRCPGVSSPSRRLGCFNLDVDLAAGPPGRRRGWPGLAGKDAGCSLRSSGTKETKDWDEEFAKGIMSHVLGVEVKRLDGVTARGDGLVDLEFPSPGGRGIAVAEVVSTREARAAELGARTHRAGYTPVKDLRRMWDVRVIPAAKVKTLHHDLPGLLAQLEAADADRANSLCDSAWTDGLRALGVRSCWSALPTEKHPPGYYLNPDAVAARVGDGDTALTACEEFVRTRPDKSEKLRRREDALERHLVVLLSIDSAFLSPFFAISAAEVPTRPPSLPPRVDALWLVPLDGREELALAYWRSPGPWKGVRIPPGSVVVGL
jgi:hypothetical protein